MMTMMTTMVTRIPPRSLVVRRFRAAACVVGLAVWVLYRVSLFFLFLWTTTSNHDNNNTSLLEAFWELWKACWNQMRAQLLVVLTSRGFFESETFCSNNDIPLMESMNDNKDCNHYLYLLFQLLRWLQIVLEDVLAIAMLATACRWVYLATSKTTSWRQTLQSSVHWTFETLREWVPAVQRELDRHGAALTADAHSRDQKKQVLRQLPATGRSYHSILEELGPLAAQEHECWRSGKQSGTVYYPQNGITDANNNVKSTTLKKRDDKDASNNNNMSHSQFLSACYALYSEANPLHFGCWPKVSQCEAEVIAMTGHLMHCPTHPATNGNDENGSSTRTACCGSITSGGTESILLAVRANQRYFGRRGGSVRHPELVCGSTAHAAVRKACDLYGIRLVQIDCCSSGSNDDDGTDGEDDYRLTAAKVKPYITANTVLIYASALCYPQGVVDDIVGLGALALRHNVGLHVDACLGGFVLPFLPWMMGVTSMSVDTHKYGMAAKGTSVVLYRQPEIRHEQYFSYADWSGGLYATPTLAGSRPGGLSVAAWASLVSMGVEGYRRSVDQIRTAVQTIVRGVASMEGLRVLGKQQYMVVCFGVDPEQDNDDLLDIYSIKDRMSEAHGWSLNDLQHPACVHLCVTLAVAPRARDFLKHLQQSVEHVRQQTKEAVEQARRDGNPKRPKKRGMAGIYGTAQSLPAGPVEYLLNIFLDETLKP